MDQRLKDSVLKKINRNRVDITKMQFVHSPIFDYDSTDVCNFSMVLNQNPAEKEEDQLKIEWKKIDHWGNMKRTHRARELRDMNLTCVSKKDDSRQQALPFRK